MEYCKALTEAETLYCFAAGDKVSERLGGELLDELSSNDRFTNWSILIIVNRQIVNKLANRLTRYIKSGYNYEDQIAP